MTTVLIAPDSFKGTASARDVTRAVARGWAAVRPDDHCLELPLADGGEGTLDALETAFPGARRVHVPQATTYGDPGSAYWLLLPDGTGVVELAVTNGIGQLPALDPMGADTRGFGEVITAALDFGVGTLLLAIGGSASSDGGSGALSALGARFLDAGDRPVRPGAAGLLDVHRVDLTELRPCPPGAVTILSDVTNPLLGPHGAAATYAPQKGADPAQVFLIESALARLASVLPAADPRSAGTGAAGGAGFGLAAWGASTASGAEEVARMCGLDAALAEADVVIVGEGAYDGQSSQGKLVGMVADRARREGKTLLLIAGAVRATPAGFDDAAELIALAGSDAEARSQVLHWVAQAASTLARNEAATA